MSSKAYKLKADASFPRPIRKRKTLTGEDFWEVEGIVYNAGSTITEDAMTENDCKRARAGDLDHLLEALAVDSEESQEDENPFVKAEAQKAEAK